jgi:hypothetical protein
MFDSSDTDLPDSTHAPEEAFSYAPPIPAEDPAVTVARQCFALTERMSAPGLGDEAVSAMGEDLAAIEGQLSGTPATTVAGVAAKMRAALYWLADGGPVGTDQELLASALDDLERMAAAAGLPVARPKMVTREPTESTVYLADLPEDEQHLVLAFRAATPEQQEVALEVARMLQAGTPRPEIETFVFQKTGRPFGGTD